MMLLFNAFINHLKWVFRLSRLWCLFLFEMPVDFFGVLTWLAAKQGFPSLRGRVMPIGRLQQFHGAVVEVELEIQGCSRSICGKGSYDANDPNLGPVLRIAVPDPSGNLELLIAEADWSGQFEASKRSGCDYWISLANSTAR